MTRAIYDRSCAISTAAYGACGARCDARDLDPLIARAPRGRVEHIVKSPLYDPKASHPVVSPLFDQALEAYLSACSKGEGAK